jgi:UDPglucose 6-dehydrogenase
MDFYRQVTVSLPKHRMKKTVPTDWERVKKNMNGDLLLDCRNILDPDRAKRYGFYYVGVGRS